MANASEDTENKSNTISTTISRLFLLNAALTFAVSVLLMDRALSKDSSHLTTSAMVTLITAVTAIVTNLLLSMAKKIFKAVTSGRASGGKD